MASLPPWRPASEDATHGRYLGDGHSPVGVFSCSKANTPIHTPPTHIHGAGFPTVLIDNVHHNPWPLCWPWGHPAVTGPEGPREEVGGGQSQWGRTQGTAAASVLSLEVKWAPGLQSRSRLQAGPRYLHSLRGKHSLSSGASTQGPRGRGAEAGWARRVTPSRWPESARPTLAGRWEAMLN